jgi:bacillithiol biosynthesis cysteine-adding enzyme BshC
MDTICIDFEKTNRFEPIFLDYIHQQKTLQPFYNLFPTIENFEKQIKLKLAEFTLEKRHTLHSALSNQYKKNLNKPQLALDLLLKENTFTLTTGHQLNIFTGPLYFHYKIMTVINAAKILREKYPQYNFVPIYWMASEDHDAEEISNFRLFGKKYIWKSEQMGAVGRFKPQSLQNVIAQVPEMHSIFQTAYSKSETLAEATRFIVNELYGSEGLLVIDGDDKEMKKSFSAITKQELLQNSSYQAMQEVSEKLANLGHKIQVNPREINLFYLENNLRERIVKEIHTSNGNNEPVYKVLNTSLAFTETEILHLVETKPELFSPNVVLRPVYQELILPNVSYTGGPGELAYWLQLKGVFESFGVVFPMLLQRNHVLYLTKKYQREMQTKEISIENLFLPAENLKQLYLDSVLQNPQNIDNEIVTINKSLKNIRTTLKNVDNSLDKYAISQQKDIENILIKMAKKLKKTQENRFEADIRQLENLQNSVCPNGGLQERSENFLSFYLNNPNFLNEIKEKLNPFEHQFYVVTEK